MSAFIESITVGGTTERSIRLSQSIIRLGPAIILLLLVLAMTLLSPVFLTGANISNVFVRTSVLAVLAALAIVVTRRLKWGRWIYAVGGDMDATVAQNPYAMGKVGVQRATKAANGESIDPRINTGLTLVTKKNVPSDLEIREEQLGSLLGVEE